MDNYAKIKMGGDQTVKIQKRVKQEPKIVAVKSPSKSVGENQTKKKKQILN